MASIASPRYTVFSDLCEPAATLPTSYLRYVQLRANAVTQLFPDTRPKAKMVLIQLLRKAPAWRKLQMVDQPNANMPIQALSGLRQRDPATNEAS